MKQASEIMNKNVLSVHFDDKLEDAVKIMTGNKVSGLPVVDKENKIIGVITDRDLLVYSEKLKVVPLFDYSGWILPLNYISDDVFYENNAKLFARTRVEDVMSKKVVTVKESASWYDVVGLMKKHSINRIPVVDEKGKLAGIITRTDVLNHIEENENTA